MRLIDADALKAWFFRPYSNEESYCNMDVANVIDKQPTIAAPRWHRVEDDPPDEKKDAIFYYEWTGISGTVYRGTSINSINELIAVGCRPIAWMEKPEPPKEGV